MNFANYTAFRVAVQQLIEGDDLGATFSVATLDLMIGLAEVRVYRDLRSTAQLGSFSLAVASNSVTLPSDLQELSEVYFAGKSPLEIIALAHLRELEAAGTSTGTTSYAAQDGDALRFWPTATGTLIGSYYKRPTALSAGLSTTFTRYPECFIFASLVESSAFLGFDARIPMWEQKYQRSISDAMEEERMRVFGGSPLRIRPR